MLQNILRHSLNLSLAIIHDCCHLQSYLTLEILKLVRYHKPLSFGNLKRRLLDHTLLGLLANLRSLKGRVVELVPLELLYSFKFVILII